MRQRGMIAAGQAKGRGMASAIQQRLLELSSDIATTPPEELAFSHTVLCQTSLPAARPPDDVLVWERRQGRAMLLVEAGKALNPRTRQFVQLGLPYGPKARLLLMHLNSEAMRQQSPVIPVEDTMTAFFRRLMGRTQDGRQAKMLKTQLSSLAAATFRMGISHGEDRALQVNTQVIGAFDLWLRNEDGQKVLWPSNLRLSQDYFDSLQRFAVPLDERAIAALAHSAVALDLYCWLAQRLHRVPDGKPQFIPWVSLQEQFGQGYARLRAFREFFVGLMQQVRSAYPEARLEVDGQGMRLWQSPPPVRKRLVAIGVSNVQSVAGIEGHSEG
jgi:Plasmid encoded RepA protein